jgi:hypothetical protein
VLLAAVLGFAGQASAATIGQTNAPTDPQVDCNGIGVFADTGYAVPKGGGTITRFSYRSQAVEQGLGVDFIVWQPANDGNPGDYVPRASSGLETLAGTGLETFPVDVPVQAGELLGYYEEDLFNCGHANPGDTELDRAISGDPGLGSTITFDDTNAGFSLNMSANLAASTTLAASPLLTTAFRPTARLTQTGTGAPIPGQTVTFETGTAKVCAATTNSQGLASCSPGLAVLALAGSGFTAAYGGSSAYAASGATARGLL